MKLTISANNKICKVKTNKNKFNNEISKVEIDFEPSDMWSDLEMWLNDDNGEFLDYMKVIISKRNKMQAYKN